MPKLSRSRFLILLLLTRCVRREGDCDTPSTGIRRPFRPPADCPSPPAPSSAQPDPFPRGDVA